MSMGKVKKKKNTHLSPGLALAQLLFLPGLLAIPCKYTVSFLQDYVVRAFMQQEPFFHKALVLANPAVPGYEHFQYCGTGRVWFPNLHSQHLISHSKISTTQILVHLHKRKVLHHKLVPGINLRPENWQLLTKLHLAY